MPLRYYPLTRIIQNRYTRGNEFSLPNGTSYTGRYYTLYNGTSYTGINPVLGTNILLTSVQDARNNPNFKGNINSQNVVTAQQDLTLSENAQLTELKPYYPIATDSNYQRGYFTRYFAKTVSGPQYVFEISKLDWTKIQNGNVSDTVLGYETADMLWQLIGPLYDTRVSQYQVKGGVYTTNKRVTEAKNKGFNGLIEFIGEDYTKFAKITP